VAIIVAANLGLLHLAGIGRHTLLAAATGTCTGTAVGLAATGVSVYRRFGAFIRLSTALRAVLSAAAGFFAAHLVPNQTRPGAVLALVVGGLCYLGALFVLREVGPRDVDLLRRVLPGRPEGS
jgi:hypothetical protein